MKQITLMQDTLSFAKKVFDTFSKKKLETLRKNYINQMVLMFDFLI